ncbi:hypothetical protein CSA37_03245 [Candidatus Fermentibacteria bacterium]|nr:MAG: hypothetical protein CSA37_03245 [Candidatus Fermentibacteria bacterium]
MREITVTIDDGGMHQAVNTAIENCIAGGYVSRVGIMATGSLYSEAIVTCMVGGVRMGAHLDCCQGPFLLRESEFPDSFAVWMKRSSALADKVRNEWSAQIEAILSAGGMVTALDSHKHLHHLPPLQDVIISIAKEYGISTVRSAIMPDKMMRFPLGLKLNHMGEKFRDRLIKEGLFTTDRMLGFGKSGRISRKYLEKYTSQCSEGFTEIVMHPAAEKVWSDGQKGEMELMLSEWFGKWCSGKN